MFGDCLEAIAAYGPTRLFTGITLNMMKQIKFGTHRLHYDTTTINVTGEYDQTFNTRLIEIVRGHSKDHRNDLKLFIISLVTNQHGIPLFMEPLSGNISDKKTLIRTILEVRVRTNTGTSTESSYSIEREIALLREVGPQINQVSGET